MKKFLSLLLLALLTIINTQAGIFGPKTHRPDNISRRERSELSHRRKQHKKTFGKGQSKCKKGFFKNTKTCP